MKCIRVMFLIIVTFCLTVHSAYGKGDDIVIAKGNVVSFDYTLTIDGEEVDSSEGKEPLEYTHGEGKIITGLSRQLEGMKAGEKKKVVVQPKEAYGEIDPNAFKEIQKLQLPSNIEPKVDMLLQMRAMDGRSIPVRISEVKDDVVVLDLNHPLAGKTLTFQVKIISVK